MKLIIQKYGGSSLATPELIKKIAERVIATKDQGYDVVVVVSALGDTTDHLQDLADQISRKPAPRELDMLLSVGERISISLLAMAITDRGYPAISFTGSQVGIITSNDHTRARILEIKGDRIRHQLEKGKVVVVAGYQGVSLEKEITTLGRGGSDTTAIALAAALNAEKCEIMTDVDGVYTANPQDIPEAKKLNKVSYDEMLELSDAGAQVLKATAVEFAKRHNIKIEVGSSFTGEIGTIITNGNLDQNRVTGVSHDEQVVLVNMKHTENDVTSSTIKKLAQKGVAVKGVWHLQQTCSFLVRKENLEGTKEILKEQQKAWPNMAFELNHDIGLVTVSGVGINFGTDVMSKVASVFNKMGVRPLTYQFSETRLSFAVERSVLKEVVKRIHEELIV